MNINILNHLPQKTFIYINKDIRIKLFNKLIKTTLTKLSKKLSINLKNLSRYKVGTRAIQKRIFLELINKAKMKLNKFQNKITIKVGKRGNKIKIGPYIHITPEWIYISELIRGDGCLARGNNNSYKTCFTNKNSYLIQFVKNFFLNKGINIKNIGIYPNTINPKVKNLTIHSEVISYLLNSFFKIHFSNKKYPAILPTFIIKDKNFAINAIRGIFDAEGNVFYMKKGNNNFRRITIAMKDEFYLKDIQKLLNKLQINSNLYKDKKDIFRLIIGDRRSIIRFYRKINSLHTEKSKKLYSIINSYKETNWISSKDLNPKILTLLFKENKKRSEICSTLSISYSKAGLRLSKLRKQNLIKINKNVLTKNGYPFIYNITNKGKNYLKETVSDFS